MRAERVREHQFGGGGLDSGWECSVRRNTALESAVNRQPGKVALRQARAGRWYNGHSAWRCAADRVNRF